MSRKKTTVSPDKEGNNKTVIVVAVIGLLGTLATAFFGFLASTKPTEITIITINATQTAEARLTLVSPIIPVATSTFTKQPDMPTPTESSGMTPTSSASKVLFDTSLQEWGALYGIGDINIVRSFGDQVDISDSPIDSSLLKQYSIVWLHNPSWELLSQEQNDALLDYVVSSGAILLVDKGDIAFGSLMNGAFPDSHYSEQGAEIRLYDSTFGLGRIAWVYPKIANPYLYFDSANQETALKVDKIRQILNWLETGVW
jgi:hypothetical protein